MALYVLERYLPGVTEEELRAASKRLATAATAISAEAENVTYLDSTFVTAEEYCFSRFEGSSADIVRRVCERANVAYARIVEARELDPRVQTIGRKL